MKNRMLVILFAMFVLTAQLWATGDVTAPTLVSAKAMSDTTVIVTFSEKMDSTTCVAVANYSLDNSIGSPTKATWNTTEVELIVPQLTEDITYTLTVNNVTDSTGNAIVANSTTSFLFKVYDGMIVINEFTYNSEYYDNEWVELYNASSETVDILGWSLRDAPTSHAPVVIPDTCDTELTPGEYFTIWTGGDGMDHGWPLHFTPDLNVGWDYSSSTETTPIGLNNDGDVLYLWDTDGKLVDVVDFTDEYSFPDAARWGTGATCELIDPAKDNNDPTNWQASWFYGGTPAAATQIERPDMPNLIISEIMYNSAGTDFEYVEIMNMETDTVDIEGYWVMDDNPLHTKLPIPDTCDTKLGPGDFFTILLARGSEPGFIPDYDISTAGDIGLNNDKDNVILFNAGDSMVTFMHYDDGGSGEEFEHANNADGSGPSLEIVDPEGVNWEPLNWQASIVSGGSPGALNATPPSLVSADVTSATTLELKYSEAVDSTESVTKANYLIDHGIGVPDTVLWVSDAVVELTVSEIKWDTTYALAVWNVSDVESGAALADSTVITYARMKDDVVPPVIAAVSALSDSVVVVEFDEEVDSTTAVVLTNYTVVPTVGNPTAVVWSGTKVTLAVSGLILDAEYTMIVNNVSDLYDNPMTVPDSVKFVLRDFSGMIVINEFTYNSEFYDNEWIELLNASDDTVDILGWSLRDEPTSHKLLVIPDTCDTELAPGEFFTIYVYGEGEEKGWPINFTPDLNRAIDYSDTTRDHIWNLNNSGDIIYLWDEVGRLVDIVDFTDEATYPDPARWGTGCTVELIDPAIENNDPENWQHSWFYGGTPGAANILERPDLPNVVINELMYNDPNGYEWVEILNLGTEAVDVSGWWVIDDNPTHVKVPVPDGTVLGAGEFLTLVNIVGSDSNFAAYDVDATASKIEWGDSKDNVILFNSDDLMVSFFHYDDGSDGDEFEHAADADGGGKTLEFWNQEGLNWAPLNWFASQDTGGTPGAENYIPDLAAPEVLSASAPNDSTVLIVFNEQLHPYTVTNVNNFAFSPAATVSSAGLSDTANYVVKLQVDDMVDGTEYTIYVSKVRDMSSNMIVDSSTVTFTFTKVAIEDIETGLPKTFALHQNYPNPFNPITTIKFDLPTDSHVKIVIFDICGREVKTLTNSNYKAGYKNIQWNARDNYGRAISSGVYFYVMETENFHHSRKMILLK